MRMTEARGEAGIDNANI